MNNQIYVQFFDEDGQGPVGVMAVLHIGETEEDFIVNELESTNRADVDNFITDWRARANLLSVGFEIDEDVREFLDELTPSSAIARYRDLVVHEYVIGYEIEHIPSGKTHWMSDGVDMFFNENAEAISPGTAEFNNAMQVDISSYGGYRDYMEAYFPEENDD